MNVSAIIVTRGDVNLDLVLDSLPNHWECVIWNNGEGYCRVIGPVPGPLGSERDVADLGVYGRYAAIEYATHDLIFVVDDDCIVSDPQAIVDAYTFITECSEHGPMKYGEVKGHWGWVCWHDDHDRAPFSMDAVVCNMPPEFRYDFYRDHALVGFGAAFHRDAPARAFERYWDWSYSRPSPSRERDEQHFRRTCDIVFTALTPRVLVDVPHEDLPHAHAPNRMWKQTEHVQERQRMLELVRQVR